MEFEIRTSERVQFLDISSKVGELISIDNGIVLVYTPHTTTGIFINENEPNLLSDIKRKLEQLVPRGAGYKHDYQEGNADSHIKSCLIGNSVIIPVENGKLKLGTWQSVFFAEFDGPRRRRIIVREIGE